MATEPRTSTQITGAYGDEKVPVHDVNLATQGAVPESVKLDTMVPINDAALQDTQVFANAAAQRQAVLDAPETTIWQGIKAAASTWDATKLINRFNRPSFDNDTPIDVTEAINNIPLALTKDEREYIVSAATGEQSFAYAVQQVQDIRNAQQIAGDHPVVGTATMFLDPAWLAVPAAFRVGKLTGAVGRAASAAVGAGVSGAITASGEGPVSDQEIALSMLMGGAASAAFFKGGKAVVKDLDHPTEALDSAVAKTKEAVQINADRSEGIQNPATGLEAGALNTDADALIKQVDKAIVKDKSIGEQLQWNMRKTMTSYGAVGKKVADIFYDNNSDLSLTSIESQRESILGGLAQHQVKYESQLRQAMADDGFGTLKMLNPMTSRDAYSAQLNIEKQVQMELFRREQSARTGTDIDSALVPKRIKDMADTLDTMHKQALKELKDAGVKGADAIEERAGYLNRKWSSNSIDTMRERMKSLSLTEEEAMRKIHQLVATAVRRGNNMEKDVAQSISQAIITRALNKGYFEDTVFNAAATEGTVNEIRSIMKAGGSNHENIERVLKAIRADADEAGKQGMLKHRMDLDYKASVNVGADMFSVTDLIDNRVTSIVDQYNRRVATSAAFARNGLKDVSSIDKLRSELSHDIADEGVRANAIRLFDNTMAHFRGEPAGASLNENFRLYQAYGRSISLALSGLWQMTEYATAMGEYGLLKTMKYAAQEIPLFRSTVNDPANAKQLNNVLSNHSVQSLRLRPYIARFEDGYSMDKTNALQLSAQTLGDLVPRANAMKYIHHHQARVVGNLILDRLEMAANGNAKAREALAKYGLEAPVMDKVAQEIKTHGFNVDAWDDKVWAATRPAFAKMMDTAVLKERLGDMPEFAKFDAVGKMLFTYRSFVLVAHNKIVAGSLQRGGAAALGLILMYQFPLAMAAVQAQNMIMGKPPMTDKELAGQAVGQMGGIGLLSEPMKWITGQSNAVGAPALIPADRGVKLLHQAVTGSPNTASTAITMLPIVAAVPFFKGVANQMKETNNGN